MNAFIPTILTDEVLSEIRKDIRKQKVRREQPIDILASAINSIGFQVQPLLPGLADIIKANMEAALQRVRAIENEDMNNISYMSGDGIVGRYLREQIRFSKLFSEKRPNNLEHYTYNPTPPDIEFEYKKLFDYNPIVLNKAPTEEFTKTEDLIKQLWHFGFHSKFFEKEKYKEHNKDAVVESNNSGYGNGILFPMFRKGQFSGSGMYDHASHYSGFKPGTLILEAPFRNTKIVLPINFSDSYGAQRARINYFHKAEDVWICDRSDFYLEGIYDALYAEANKFLITLNPLFDLSHIHETYKELIEKNFKKLQELYYAVAEVDQAGHIEKVDKLFNDFRFRKTEVTGTYSFTIGTYCYEVTHIPENSTSRWNYALNITTNKNIGLNESIGKLTIIIGQSKVDDEIEVTTDCFVLTAVHALSELQDMIDGRLEAVKNLLLEESGSNETDGESEK